MLTVGASSTRAPFDSASSANAWPTSSTSGVFQEEASEMPTGKAAAATPPTSDPPPRAPLGPSLTLMAGTPTRSTGTVVQKSAPDSSETCSSRVMDWTRASM